MFTRAFIHANIQTRTHNKHAHKTGEVEEDGYADEYQLEDLEVSAPDYMSPVVVPNFRHAWCV